MNYAPESTFYVLESPGSPRSDIVGEDDAMSQRHEERTSRSLMAAFWLLGLFNHASYVIMIASAKTISEGGTGMVFLANTIPGMLVKISAPYWFDYVSYERRILIAFACMVGSFGMVASSEATAGKLFGVLLGSVKTGLGEASLLAAAGKCDSTGHGHFISAFSSGTGAAGFFGFLWKFVWNEWFQLSMSTTLWLAQSIAVLYIVIFWKYLHAHLVGLQEERYAQTEDEQRPLEMATLHVSPIIIEAGVANRCAVENFGSKGQYDDPDETISTSEDSMTERTQLAFLPTKTPVHQMTVTERAHFVLDLWPYIVPLFVVYAAEYSLQAGTWTAIGFPVESKVARDKFYEFGNWMYHAGSFLSRSSGSLGTVSMSLLWLMPTLQVLNVVFFTLVAAEHFWYNYALLIPCFYAGLLGGAVYVHGYKRICADFGIVDRREFALAATSVAESFGIVCADIMGLFIQACLYQINGIEGAAVSCPISTTRR